MWLWYVAMCCHSLQWGTVQKPSLGVSRVAGEILSPSTSFSFYSTPDCLEEQVFVVEDVVFAQVHKFIKIFRGVDQPNEVVRRAVVLQVYFAFFHLWVATLYPCRERQKPAQWAESGVLSHGVVGDWSTWLDPLIKTALRKYCKPTPQLERAIPGQFSELLLPPPAKAQTWKSFSRAGTNSYIPPCPAPADTIPGQHAHEPTSFPKPCKSDSRTKTHTWNTFQNPWSPPD